MNRPGVKKIPFMQMRGGVQVFNDAFSFVTNIVSLIGTAAAMLGGGYALTGISAPALSLPTSSVALRLLLFLVLTTALGWSLGWILRRTTTLKQDFFVVLSFLVAIIWGIVIVALAETLSRKIPVLELQIFALLGLAVVLRLSHYRLRNTGEPMSIHTIRLRSHALLALTVTVIGVFLLTAMGN